MWQSADGALRAAWIVCVGVVGSLPFLQLAVLGLRTMTLRFPPGHSSDQKWSRLRFIRSVDFTPFSEIHDALYEGVAVHGSHPCAIGVVVLSHVGLAVLALVPALSAIALAGK